MIVASLAMPCGAALMAFAIFCESVSLFGVAFSWAGCWAASRTGASNATAAISGILARVIATSLERRVDNGLAWGPNQILYSRSGVLVKSVRYAGATV